MASESEKPILRVQNLVKRFDDKLVLDGVSLDVYPGQTLVIMGSSGCGKSTLLRHMTGLLWPDSGSVEVLGQDLAEMPPQRLDELRLKLGILFQSGALFNSLTVGQNVALPLQEHTELDEQTIEIMVKLKLEQVYLRGAVDLMPSELSGGMRKRAGLARAIALDPVMLFYDEPTAGLDPPTAAQIDQLIVDQSHKMGTTSVVVTHEMGSAFRIADRIAMMHEGRVLKVGPVGEFRQLRDGPPPADDTGRLIRRFLCGEPPGGDETHIDDIVN